MNACRHPALVRDLRCAAGMRESNWVLAFLLAVPACAVLGAVIGWASFGASVSAAAEEVAVGNDSLQPAFELAAGAGAAAWNALVLLAGGLIGALSGLILAPFGVRLGRQRAQT